MSRSDALAAIAAACMGFMPLAWHHFQRNVGIDSNWLLIYWFGISSVAIFIAASCTSVIKKMGQTAEEATKAKQERKCFDKTGYILLAAFGLVSVIANFLLMRGIKNLGPELSAFTLHTSIIFTLIIAFVVKDKKGMVKRNLTKIEVISILLVTFGLFTMKFSNSIIPSLWVMVMIGVGALLAISIKLGQYIVENYSINSQWLNVVRSTSVFVYMFLFVTTSEAAKPSLSIENILLMIGAIIIISVIGNGCRLACVKNANIARVKALISTNSLFTLTYSCLLFGIGDKLSPQVLIGSGMIVIGAIAIGFSKAPKKEIVKNDTDNEGIAIPQGMKTA